MKVAIIGAGFTGLAAAYDLLQAGCQVHVIESDNKPGGLASGFYASDRDWSWPLEHHYHHVFKTDKALKRWLKDLKLADDIFFQDTQTASLSQKGLFQLDSASSLLRYPHLSWADKLRTGAVLAFLKSWPWGRSFEVYTAEKFLRRTMGEESWHELWEPLFRGKFGSTASDINAAWFWARIYARSKQLGYFKQGFLGLTQQIKNKLQQQGVQFHFKTSVDKILKQDSKLQVVTEKETQNFDKVLFTGPAHVLKNLAASSLPQSYLKQLDKHEYLAAMTLVLVLDKPFFEDDLYWLNINRSDWPFLAVVEHTNFIDSQFYNHDHLLYVGKYLSPEEPFFDKNEQEVLEVYKPFLRQLKPGFEKQIQTSFLFKSQMAQPVVKKNHSRILPSSATPLAGLYWAGMQHVYPYDRGINYAIQLGRETVKTMFSSVKENS